MSAANTFSAIAAKRTNRTVPSALLVAVGLLTVSGAGFRALDSYLGEGSAPPLARGTLSRVPLRLGQWSGKDSPIDEAIREQTDTDDLLSRQYIHDNGRARVMLYIAAGVRARDLMPHRPEVCYPGAGWTLEETRTTGIRVQGDEVLPCRLLVFTRGSLDSRKIVVLDYYIVDGQYCPDVSLLRSKAWRGSRAIQYLFQVQVMCGRGDAEDSDAAVTAFVVEAAPAIRSILVELTRDGATGAASPRPPGRGGTSS